MQNRMLTHALEEEKILALLAKAPTGALATINEDGTPYVIPVHFAYVNNKLYLHSLNAGQKIENIHRNNKISFTVWEMFELILHPEGKPCGTNTTYQSVIIAGTAMFITDLEDKRLCLKKIIAKYTPDLTENPMADSTIEKTAVIEISIDEITGKYY